MNIIKLQDELRGVPDNALIGYVQNPTGNVPSYLALSELQRRKDMRAKYQAQQAPQSSVADDLEQQATPQPQAQLQEAQGVAGLPVPETMYQEDSFASGGIVAFPTGGYVSSDPRPYYYGEDEDKTTSPFGRLADYLDISKKVKESDFGKRREERKKLDEQIQETVPTLIGGKRGWFDSETKAQQREYEQRRRELEASKNQSPYFAPEAGGYDNKGVAPALSDIEVIQNELRNKNKNTSNQQPGNKAIATQAAKQVTQQPAESEDDFLRRRMAIYKEFMGGDEDKTALKDKLSAMEKRAIRQEEMAPWMALTEAGFKTMQGTSPYALANIGAGAEAGLKSYGSAQDKMAALEEKRYALMNEAAKADRAEKQAGITFGENSYQHKAAMDQRDRIANMNADLKREQIGVERARVDAISGKSNTKGMVDQILKANKDIDSSLAAYKMVRNPSKEVLDMIKKLEADKAANEIKIKSYYNQSKAGLANTTFNNDDWAVEELAG
jgi:hypothetical protein